MIFTSLSPDSSSGTMRTPLSGASGVLPNLEPRRVAPDFPDGVLALRGLGVDRALARAGARAGDRVHIGGFEFDYEPDDMAR